MILDDKLMKYVLFKKRTRNEVKEKCRQLQYEDDYIEQVLEYLEENSYINDEIYVQKYIANVKKLKNASIKEIEIDLLRRGIDNDIIEKYLDEDLMDFELQSAMTLAQKKKKTTEIDKIKRFLLNKGYSYDNVTKAIDNLEQMDDNE